MRISVMSVRRLSFLAIFSALFFLPSLLPLHAAFPPVVVSGTIASVGEAAGTDSSSLALYKYVFPDGVLVLHGANGGPVGWGTDLTSATNETAISGTWNGNYDFNPTPAGHVLTIPRILLYGTAGSPSIQIDGLNNTVTDPNTRLADPVGSATLPGSTLFAYRKLKDGTDISDGFLFRFLADGSKYYKYMAGSAPVQISGTAGWTASTLFSFPQTIAVSGTSLSGTTTLTQTSLFEGLADCYWANAYYEDGSGNFGELHVYIGRGDGTQTGKVWGYIGSTTVSADWDPNSMLFLDDPTVSWNPQQNGPAFGPKYIAWEGDLLEFAYTDYEGSDVYWEEQSRKKVVISNWLGVTASDPFSTSTGSYDSALLYFNIWPTLVQVNDARTDFEYSMWSLRVITNGEYPGEYHGQWSVFSPRAWLTRADGSVVYLYPDGVMPGAEVYYVGDSPYYFGYDRIDKSSGSWPASDLAWPVVPDVVYVQGIPAGISSISQPYYDENGSFVRDVVYTGGPMVSAFIRQYGQTGDQTVWGTFGQWANPAEVTYDPPPARPSSGPACFTWYGLNLRYRSTVEFEGALYSDDNGLAGVWVRPDGSLWSQWPVDATGTFDSNFRFYPSSQQSEFATFAMQDANGDLLGTDPGVVMVFGADGGGTELAVGNGAMISSTTNPVYKYRKMDSSWGVKYAGIPKGTLLIAKGTSGQFDSPVYRCTGSNGTISGLSGWAESNLYPAELYVNGHHAGLNAAASTETGSGLNRAGSHQYVLSSGTESITLSWTWTDTAGFSGSVAGNISSYSSISGTWDGGDILRSLPAGLIVSTEAPPANARYGPAKIDWNGVTLVFDSLASSVSGVNPAGADIYRDLLGLGLTIQIGPGGAVTLVRADGTTIIGSYDAGTKQFSFSGSSAQPGSVIPVDGNRLVVQPGNTGSGTPPDAPTEVHGDFDIFGNVLSFGNWNDTSGNSVNALTLSFTEGTGTQPSLLEFASSKANADWLWSHSQADGAAAKISTMRLDARNRLILYKASDPYTPTIILDPNGGSQIEPQGDLDMGEFKTRPQTP